MCIVYIFLWKVVYTGGDCVVRPTAMKDRDNRVSFIYTSVAKRKRCTKEWREDGIKEAEPTLDSN